MIPLLRKMLPFLTVAVLIAAAYDGWYFYSRWRDTREGERASKAAQADEARKIIDKLGGGELKILSFYASPAAIRPGEHANLCYGVYGATTLRMEPAVEELHPAVSHCLQVSPTASTEYKLIAEDGKGHTSTSAVTLKVGR